MLKNIKVTLANDIVSSLIKAAELAVLTLVESFFLQTKKKEMPRKVTRKKVVCLYVCLSACLSACLSVCE